MQEFYLPHFLPVGKGSTIHPFISDFFPYQWEICKYSSISWHG